MSCKFNHFALLFDMFHHRRHILNEDTFGKIFGFFRSVTDLEQVLLVNRTWNSQLRPVVLKMMDHFIQNQFIEHQKNFDIGKAKYRQTMESAYEPVMAFPYCETIPDEGARFQTWKVNLAIWSGKFYFEVKFISNVTYTQIGWMSAQCDCKPIGLTMKGVGDDDNSWSYDPHRNLIFHGDTGDTSYGVPSEEELRKMCLENPSHNGTAQVGDVIGCLFDSENREISFSRNGKNLGVAFSNIVPNAPYYPALTKANGGVVQVVLFPDELRFQPEGYKAVGTGIPKSALLFEALLGKNYKASADKYY